MSFENSSDKIKINSKYQTSNISHIKILISIASIIFFLCSSVRHSLFQSGAFDIGIYDQVAYLMSQGLTPVSSFLGFHHMGNHAAYTFYLVGFFYKIYPSIHWLFAIQAFSLSVAVLPIWYLGLQAGLNQKLALTITYVYLLYPLIFNVNLYDFHPEVMAIPVIFTAVLMARQKKVSYFCLCILFILGCKAVLSLTVLAMGLWLVFGEKRALCGAIAISLGITWFIVVTQIIIPEFSGAEAAAIHRFDEFGDSVFEIFLNLLLQPQLLLKNLFTLPNLEYLLFFIIPVIYGIVPQYVTPMIAALPTLLINLITDYYAQKNLVHHYSLPAIPFLILAVISALAANKAWLKSRNFIILWAMVAFLGFAKYGYFWSRYLSSIDTWKATREAIEYVRYQDGVLTTNEIAPHLTHRQLIKLTTKQYTIDELNQFHYVLLNLRHPGWASDFESSKDLVNKLEKIPEFQLTYQKDEVYLFAKIVT